jgi:hypothetical protein
MHGVSIPALFPPMLFGHPECLATPKPSGPDRKIHPGTEDGMHFQVENKHYPDSDPVFEKDFYEIAAIPQV